MAERTKIIGAGQRDPESIRADIERTRKKLSRTMGEFRERFTSEHMKSVAGSAVKDRAAGMALKAREGVIKARTGMYELVRDNPLPAAMVGLGLSWFLTDILLEGPRFGRDMEREEHAEREHWRLYPEGAGENASRKSAQYAGRRAMEGPGLISGRFGAFPLILLGASMAAGAALAMNMPSSELESDIGEAVRKVRSKARVKADQFNQELRETT